MESDEQTVATVRAMRRARQGRERDREILNRYAGDGARHRMDAAADGDRDIHARGGELGGDFARGVAGADDEHALAPKGLGPPVLDTVNHATAKPIAIANRRHVRV